MERRKFIASASAFGLALSVSPSLLSATSGHLALEQERWLVDAFRQTVAEYPAASQQGASFINQMVEPVTVLEVGKDRLRYLNERGSEILLVKRKGKLIFSCK